MSNLPLPPPPEPFTHARWIWSDQYFWDLHNGFAQFRKSFELPRVPKKAPLFITADQHYHLYINGRFVCRGPARGFQSHWPYDEIDVAAYLVAGRNVIAVRGYNAGFSTFQYLTQGTAGLLVGARWGTTLLVSDTSWKSRRQEGISRDTVQVSLQLNPQEHIDCRQEPADWMAPEFADAGWENASSMAAFGGMPWHAVEPRGIPLMDERRMAPTAVIGAAVGTSAAGWRDVRDVARLAWSEDLTHAVADSAVLLPRFTVAATGADGYRRVLLDFGRCVVGAPEVVISGGRGGEIIDLVYTETINDRTLRPDVEYPTGCKLAMASRLTCRAGETRHAFYHPYGFRYLLVIVRGATAALAIDVALNWVGYPLVVSGALRTDDALLADIWRISAWTQQCCMMDAYVDTPWREQAQWWGDARVQGWNTFHLSGDARLFRRGIAQIAGQGTPEGLTYGHAPTIAHNCILPDFSLIWLITLWDHYWQTGSTEAFTTHRARIDELLAYFRLKQDPTSGLLPYDNRYWLFLDWAPIHKEGYPTVYNAWFVIALEKIAELAALTGDKQSAKAWRAWAKPVRGALSKLIDKRGLLRDGLDWQRKPVASTSVHAQTLALHLQLDGHDGQAALSTILLPYINGAEIAAVKPSAYWVTYVFSALSARGHGAEVLSFIKQHWAPMVAHGTTWEDWVPKRGDVSHSHAWSAHPLFHTMQIIGGLRQTAAGWTTLNFAPEFIGDHGGATIPTASGPVVSDWRRSAKGVHVALSLPPGVSADVTLPGMKKITVSGKQRWLLPE